MTEENEAANFDESVRDKLENSNLTEAKKEFTRKWRETTPGLPERIPMILTGVEKTGVDYIMRYRRKNDKEPGLKLEGNLETEVQVSLSRVQIDLGFLRASDRAKLKAISLKALQLYSAHILEIRRNEEGEIETVAIELVVKNQDQAPHPALHEAVDALLEEEN